MNRQQTRYALLALAISLVFIAPIAIAQGTFPHRDNDAYATPINRLMTEPLARDFGTESWGRTIAPLNVQVDVWDDGPQDLRDMQPRTWCRNDPLTGKIPVECRRWSELASLRLRSET